MFALKSHVSFYQCLFSWISNLCKSLNFDAWKFVNFFEKKNKLLTFVVLLWTHNDIGNLLCSINISKRAIPAKSACRHCRAICGGEKDCKWVTILPEILVNACKVSQIVWLIDLLDSVAWNQNSKPQKSLLQSLEWNANYERMIIGYIHRFP